MSDNSIDGRPMFVAVSVMNDGLVALFKSLMLIEDYEEAIEFVERTSGFIPTPFVINEIIFKIMMNSNENLVYEAAAYLEGRLMFISNDDDVKKDLIKALNDQSRTNSDSWDVFSRLVWSSLYHLEVSEADHIHRDYVISPNCDILIDIYVKAFLTCSIERDLLRSRAEERLSILLKWISLYYKYNLMQQPELVYLHNLLDYIVDSKIAGDSSLPLSVKIHTVNLSPYMSLILSICKDVFATPEKQISFFALTNSSYLITKICQYRLHELLDEKALPQNPGPLTLKLIVDNYFFQCPEKKSETGRSGRKKLKKFSKDAIPGDTEFHAPCRLGRPADLLCALYADKNKDINKKNSAGNTPLHEACLASSYLCTKFLIEETSDRKVDFRAKENEGRTPLHCAVYVNAFDIVKLLLDRGGNDLIKCLDNSGSKPIDYCTSDKMKKMLQEIESKSNETVKLKENGVKLPNLKNSKDYPLYLQTLKAFVSHYCDIYGLPKTEPVKTLSHNRKECYHYKADSETSCMEDSSTLDTFMKVIKKFLSCVELLLKEESIKEKLSEWKRFETAIKERLSKWKRLET